MRRDDGDTLDSATTSDHETAGDDLAPTQPPASPVRLGQGDRYRLGSALGRGGMGEVMTATDEMIGREVAIKRMLRANASERSMARFFREATVQGRLDHPAIAPVHELGVDLDGRPFFVMKKLAGKSMAQLIAGDPSRNRLLRAFTDVCLAVELAHTRGVVHRDLKPDNILLGEFGEVYVIDWGVAKIASDPDDDSPEFTRVELAELHTAMGVAIGTPGYMSPEQARGARDVDGRADVYSLGCVLFEILTGEMMQPKGERTPRGGRRPSTLASDIPPELDALVLHATAPERESRVRSARELGERVQLYLDGDRDVALRRGLAAEHLVAARDAFSRAELDPDARVTAMREAGRALALDPKLDGAGELLSRLMLEPPKATPPGVEQEILADKLEEIHRHSGTGIRGYFGYLAAVPLLAIAGALQLYAIALVVIVGLNIALLRRRATIATLDKRAVALALANALLIGLVTRMFSPFICAPAIAAATATALVFGPSYDQRWRVIAVATVMALACLLPWLAEAVGVLAPTSTLSHSGLLAYGPALLAGNVWAVLAIVLMTIATIFSAAGMAYRMSAADRAVRRRLHMQTWQLRQLVPVPSR